MTVDQTQFAQAALDPDLPVPAGLSAPDGTGAGRRFAVYRNNIAVSLTEALETAFPVIRKLVGEEFFAALAGVYLRRYPPGSPLLMLYGHQMPDFLADFAPVAHLGYLPDVARLELGLRTAYHAADASAIDPQVLAETSPDRLATARIALAPAVRLIRSPWPIHGIWLYNSWPGAAEPVMGPENVMITRPDFDPLAQPVAPAAAGCLEALARGMTLGQATAAAGDDLDLSALLAALLAGGAIVGLNWDE